MVHRPQAEAAKGLPLGGTDAIWQHRMECRCDPGEHVCLCGGGRGALGSEERDFPERQSVLAGDGQAGDQGCEVNSS